MKKALLIAVAILLTLAWAVPAQGQARIDELDLPRHVAEDVIVYFNSPGTVRFNGRSTLPGDGIIVGDVGVLGGPFTVAGEIRGDLIVVNGDLVFREEGRVDGDVTVIGGRASGVVAGSVGGTLAVYDEPLRYAERAGEIRIRPRGGPGLGAPGWVTLGQSRLLVRTGGSYNRVEGLPVMMGPVWETVGNNPFRADALGIWRSESGLKIDDDELGYFFRARQSVGSAPRVTVGATYHSMVSPIADWGLTSIESSLSTFFFHKDFRDYMDRQGWGTFVTLDSDGSPLSVTVEYRDEDHAFAPVSSPWTLRKNDDPWRPQPVVAEGDIRTLSGTVVWDDRNDPDRPSDGWLAQARVIRGVSGELVTPELYETAGPSGPSGLIPSLPVEPNFTAGLLDVRRYNRLSPDAELNFRVLYGGSLNGDPVPSQYQQALGGEGSLPGYGLFELDCGARDRTLQIERTAFDAADPVQPAYGHYGCDGALLFQVEYRGHLSVNIDLGPNDSDDWENEWGWYPDIDLSPSWVAFFDVGRGWSESNSLLSTDTFADVGLGFYLGDLGFYWAYPLEGDDRNVNFFIRLQRRF